MKGKSKKMKRGIVLVLCVMLGTVMIGCGEVEPTTDDSPDTSAVESEVSSTSEVSEPVSEEPSEEVVSEEPVEETMDLTPYTTENGKKVIDLVNDMEYNEFKVIVWNDYGAKAILSEGDSYQIRDEDDKLYLYYPDQIENFQPNSNNIEVVAEIENGCLFRVYGTDENMEVNFTATDVDGKEYEITVYITKDWKYEWEIS